jgi:hypothetical protein
MGPLTVESVTVCLVDGVSRTLLARIPHLPPLRRGNARWFAVGYQVPVGRSPELLERACVSEREWTRSPDVGMGACLPDPRLSTGLMLAGRHCPAA